MPWFKSLTEPKNALIKQYKRLFDMDGVQLKFTPEALGAIAEQAETQGRRSRDCVPFWRTQCSISCTRFLPKQLRRKSS